MNYLQAFARELHSGRADPERLALLIGGLYDDHLDIAACVERIDKLADEIAPRLTPGLQGRRRIETLITSLADDMGFTGNRSDYYDPANSFLHLVLERKVGLPITLSLLYMAVGKRLGLRLEGMGLPGHFMLRYEAEDGFWLLDPFNGDLLPETHASHYLTNLFAKPLRLQEPLDSYRTDSRLLIFRVLNNLRATYLDREAFEQAIQVLDFMVLVEPEEAMLWRERGLLNFQSGRFLDAENDLRRFFYHRRLFHHFIENQPIAGQVPFQFVQEAPDLPPLPEDAGDLIAVLERIRVSVARLN